LLTLLIGELALCVAVSSAAQPGLTVTLSSAGLNYVAKTAVSLVRAEWGKVPIPGSSGSVTYPILGTIDYSLRDIKLAPNPTLPDPTVTLVSPSLLFVEITGSAFAVSFDFDYKAHNWSSVVGNGTINVAVTNFTLTTGLTMIADSHGRPSLNITYSNASATDVKIVISGNASWMQDWVNILKSTITSQLLTQVASMVKTYGDQVGNQLLEYFPSREPVFGLAQVDLSLVTNPMFAPVSGISVFCKGAVLALQNPVEPPFSPSPMPYTVTQEMLQVFISDYVLNSAGFALFKAGLLAYNITDQMIPSYSPIRLNTSSWSFILPQLASKYPNTAMIATIQATQPPSAIISPKGISLAITSAIQFQVLPTGSMATPVFTIGLNLTAAMMVHIVNGSLLTANISNLVPSVAMLWSDVGTIPLSLLNQGIQALTSMLLPVVNDFLSRGFPLPAFPGLTLTNPTIGYGQDYFFLSSSFSFQPSIVPMKSKAALGTPVDSRGRTAIAIN